MAVLISACAIAGCGSAARTSTQAARTLTAASVSSNPFPEAGDDDQPVTCSSAQSSARHAAIIHRPSSLAVDKPAPLLIALHGSGGDGHNMEGLTHFTELADREGFVVALLSSCDLDNAWAPPQDLTYISSVITRLASASGPAGAIDRSRVYVTGFSAGGAETWAAGCRLSRQVAAIAVVSDAMNGRLYASCSPSRPVPELLLVGTADSTRWTGIPRRLPSAYQTTARWRQLDGCGARPTSTRQVSTVREEVWRSCADGSAVALYIVQGASHVWPPYGDGAPKDYSASAAVWSFLSAFRLGR